MDDDSGSGARATVRSYVHDRYLEGSLVRNFLSLTLTLNNLWTIEPSDYRAALVPLLRSSARRSVCENEPLGNR